MRQIKFRAWDKSRGEWYGESDPRILTFKDFHIFGECTLLCTPPIDELQHLEITQFTGLLDKKGKEIYENDVLKSRRTSLNYQVVWDNDEACFTASCAEPEKDFIMAAYSWHENEVIGNIYKNSDLIDN